MRRGVRELARGDGVLAVVVAVAVAVAAAPLTVGGRPRRGFDAGDETTGGGGDGTPRFAVRPDMTVTVRYNFNGVTYFITLLKLGLT